MTAGARSEGDRDAASGVETDDTPHIGCDEAGKGPVLGPMVAAAVRASPARLPDGVDDSKRLTAATRESIAAALHDSDGVAVGVAVVPIDRIDDPGTDMNSLTVAAHGEAIAAVARDGDVAVVDAADVDAGRFGERVRSAVRSGGPSIDVRAEHGADTASPVVGAASVVAKVERDARMSSLAADYAEYGPIGSGYPSDPKTRAFLREYVGETGELPDCARASWATADDVLAAAEQSSLSEF
jgi:ribonuclease HII